MKAIIDLDWLNKEVEFVESVLKSQTETESENAYYYGASITLNEVRSHCKESKEDKMLEMLKIYLSDLNNLIPDSGAKRSRIHDIEQLIKEAEQ